MQNDRTFDGAQTIVKKYPNRRLYDSGRSRYITLSDIRNMVVKQVQFVVIDTRAKTDITDRVLLQVLTVHHELAKKIISREWITRAIREHSPASD